MVLRDFFIFIVVFNLLWCCFGGSDIKFIIFKFGLSFCFLIEFWEILLVLVSCGRKIFSNRVLIEVKIRIEIFVIFCFNIYFLLVNFKFGFGLSVDFFF